MKHLRARFRSGLWTVAALEPAQNQRLGCGSPRALQPGMTDLFLYDRRCRWCASTASQIRARSKHAIVLLWFESKAPHCEHVLHLIKDEGGIEAGASALIAALRHRWFGPLLRVLRVPPLRSLTEWVLRRNARQSLWHRDHRKDKGSAWHRLPLLRR